MSDAMQTLAEALVSPVRRKILAYLSAGSLSAGEIAERFDITKPSLSAHLNLLVEAGLVARERQGTHIYYSLVEESLFNKLHGLIQQVCPVGRPLRREAQERARTPEE